MQQNSAYYGERPAVQYHFQDQHASDWKFRNQLPTVRRVFHPAITENAFNSLGTRKLANTFGFDTAVLSTGSVVLHYHGSSVGAVSIFDNTSGNAVEQSQRHYFTIDGDRIRFIQLMQLVITRYLRVTLSQTDYRYLVSSGVLGVLQELGHVPQSIRYSLSPKAFNIVSGIVHERSSWDVQGEVAAFERALQSHASQPDAVQASRRALHAVYSSAYQEAAGYSVPVAVVCGAAVGMLGTLALQHAYSNYVAGPLTLIRMVNMFKTQFTSFVNAAMQHASAENLSPTMQWFARISITFVSVMHAWAATGLFQQLAMQALAVVALQLAFPSRSLSSCISDIGRVWILAKTFQTILLAWVPQQSTEHQIAASGEQGVPMHYVVASIVCVIFGVANPSSKLIRELVERARNAGYTARTVRDSGEGFATLVGQVPSFFKIVAKYRSPMLIATVMRQGLGDSQEKLKTLLADWTVLASAIYANEADSIVLALTSDTIRRRAYIDIMRQVILLQTALAETPAGARHSMARTMNEVLRRHLRWYNLAVAVEGSPKSVIAPFAVSFAGEKGLGKTALVNFASQAVFGEQFNVYTRNPGTEHWDRYSPAYNTVLFDDLGMFTDANDYADFMSVISSAPVVVPMASVDPESPIGVKGTIFSSPLVFVTSNAAVPNAGNKIANIPALLRRRKLCYLIKARDGVYDDTKGQVDWAKVKETGIKGYDHALVCFPYPSMQTTAPNTSGTGITVTEMLQQIRDGFIAHVNEQVKYLEALGSYKPVNPPIDVFQTSSNPAEITAAILAGTRQEAAGGSKKKTPTTLASGDDSGETPVKTLVADLSFTFDENLSTIRPLAELCPQLLVPAPQPVLADSIDIAENGDWPEGTEVRVLALATGLRTGCVDQYGCVHKCITHATNILDPGSGVCLPHPYTDVCCFPRQTTMRARWFPSFFSDDPTLESTLAEKLLVMSVGSMVALGLALSIKQIISWVTDLGTQAAASKYDPGSSRAARPHAKLVEVSVHQHAAGSNDAKLRDAGVAISMYGIRGTAMGHTLSIRGTMVKGQVCLLPAHVFDVYRPADFQYEFGFQKLYADDTGMTKVTFEFEELIVCTHDSGNGTLDACTIKLPMRVRAFPDITSYFVDETMLPGGTFGVASMVPGSTPVCYTGSGEVTGRTVGYITRGGRVWTATNPIEMDLFRETDAISFCGSLVTTGNPGGPRLVLGYLVSLRRVPYTATATIITHQLLTEMLRAHSIVVEEPSALARFSVSKDNGYAQLKGSFSRVGYTGTPGHIVSNRLRQSEVLCDTLAPPTRVPSITDRRSQKWQEVVRKNGSVLRGLSPLTNGVAKYGVIGGQLRPRSLRRATELVRDMIGYYAADVDFPIYTLDEACTGSDRGCGLRPADMTTSAGVPYTMSSQTRSSLTTRTAVGNRVPTPAFRAKCEALEHDLKRGLLRDVVWFDFPKAELLKPEKVDAGRTRHITCAPFDFYLVSRRYFGAADAFIKKLGLKAGFAPGINPESYEWDELVSRLVRAQGCTDDNVELPQVLALDYQRFDGSLTPELMSAALGIMGDLYVGASREDELLRECVAYNLVHTQALCEDLIYQKHQGNPSGCFCTTTLNTICNMILLEYASHEAYGESLMKVPRHHPVVEPVVPYAIYGDDNIVAPPASMWKHDFSHLSTVLANYGYGLKSETGTWDLLPIGDPRVRFLKRAFHRVQGRWQPQINSDIIADILNYTREHDERANTLVMQARIHSAATFMYFYGHEAYTDFEQRVAARLENKYDAPSIPTYTMLNQLYHAGRLVADPDELEYQQRNNPVPAFQVAAGQSQSVASTVNNFGSGNKTDIATKAKADKADEFTTDFSPETNVDASALDSHTIGNNVYSGERIFAGFNSTTDHHTHLEVMDLRSGIFNPCHPDHFGENENILDVVHLTQLSTRSAVHVWTTGDPRGTVLATGEISPFQVYADVDDKLTNMAPAELLARLTAFWRGGVNFDIEVIGTKFTTGRLLFALHYGVYDRVRVSNWPLEIQTGQYGQYINIREGEGRTRITAKMISSTPWMNTLPDFGAMGMREPDITSSYGTWSLVVVNPLAVPSSVAPNVDINIYYSGADSFQVHYPLSANNMLPQLGPVFVPTAERPGSDVYYGVTTIGFQAAGDTIITHTSSTPALSPFYTTGIVRDGDDVLCSMAFVNIKPNVEMQLWGAFMSNAHTVQGFTMQDPIGITFEPLETAVSYAEPWGTSAIRTTFTTTADQGTFTMRLEISSPQDAQDVLLHLMTCPLEHIESVAWKILGINAAGTNQIGTNELIDDLPFLFYTGTQASVMTQLDIAVVGTQYELTGYTSSFGYDTVTNISSFAEPHHITTAGANPPGIISANYNAGTGTALALSEEIVGVNLDVEAIPATGTASAMTYQPALVGMRGPARFRRVGQRMPRRQLAAAGDVISHTEIAQRTLPDSTVHGHGTSDDRTTDQFSTEFVDICDIMRRFVDVTAPGSPVATTVAAGSQVIIHLSDLINSRRWNQILAGMLRYQRGPVRIRLFTNVASGTVRVRVLAALSDSSVGTACELASKYASNVAPQMTFEIPFLSSLHCVYTGFGVPTDGSSYVTRIVVDNFSDAAVDLRWLVAMGDTYRPAVFTGVPPYGVMQQAASGDDTPDVVSAELAQAQNDEMSRGGMTVLERRPAEQSVEVPPPHRQLADLHMPETSWSMPEVMNRLGYVTDVSWSVLHSTNTNLVRLQIPFDLFANSFSRMPIDFHRYLRFKAVRIRFQLNGTPMHQGRLIAYYQPGITDGDHSMRYGDVGFAPALNHVMLNPTESTVADLVIPFNHPLGWLHLGDGGSLERFTHFMGYVWLDVFNMLQIGATGTSSINVNITASFEDAIPTVPLAEPTA